MYSCYLPSGALERNSRGSWGDHLNHFPISGFLWHQSVPGVTQHFDRHKEEELHIHNLYMQDTCHARSNMNLHRLIGGIQQQLLSL